MSKSPFLRLTILVAPLIALVGCSVLNSNAPKASIYRIAVSGAN